MHITHTQTLAHTLTHTHPDAQNLVKFPVIWKRTCITLIVGLTGQ